MLVIGFVLGVIATFLVIWLWYISVSSLNTGIYQDDDVMVLYGELLDEQERKVGSSEKTEDPRRD